MRAHAREAGSASQSSASIPVPPMSPRQFLVPLPATAGGTESAERGGANGQPKEVCDWAGGGSISGFPLGSQTGASPN